MLRLLDGFFGARRVRGPQRRGLAPSACVEAPSTARTTELPTNRAASWSEQRERCLELACRASIVLTMARSASDFRSRPSERVRLVLGTLVRLASAALREIEERAQAELAVAPPGATTEIGLIVLRFRAPEVRSELAVLQERLEEGGRSRACHLMAAADLQRALEAQLVEIADALSAVDAPQPLEAGGSSFADDDENAQESTLTAVPVSGVRRRDGSKPQHSRRAIG